MQDYFELIALSPDMPRGTDFCLIMDNDLMEPVIQKGGRVCVSRHEEPAQMELGIFLYRGQVFCRQVCEDYAGNLHLLCVNPKAEAENLCLDKNERERCLCLGRVLLDKAPPMPIYD